MYTRKIALALATQARACPPKKVLEDPKNETQRRAHLAICPFCSIGKQAELDAVSKLAQNLIKETGQSIHMPPLEIGQIWCLDPALAVWQDSFFYTPPIIAVLDISRRINDEILVAQTWHDFYLAGPGDIVLQPPHIEPALSLFLETWNIYTIKKNNLLHCIGILSSQVIEDAFKMKQDPNYRPPWATVTLPIEKNDPRFYFRRLEAKTASAFTARETQPLLDTITSTVSELMEAIKGLVSGVDWPGTPETPEECFATIRFPSEAIALAASTIDQKRIIISYLCIENDRVVDIYPVYALVYDESRKPGSYTVSGKLQKNDFNLRTMELYCYLCDTQQKKLQKGKLELNRDSGVFMAIFPTEKTDSSAFHLFAINKSAE